MIWVFVQIASTVTIVVTIVQGVGSGFRSSQSSKASAAGVEYTQLIGFAGVGYLYGCGPEYGLNNIVSRNPTRIVDISRKSSAGHESQMLNGCSCFNICE